MTYVATPTTTRALVVAFVLPLFALAAACGDDDGAGDTSPDVAADAAIDSGADVGGADVGDADIDADTDVDARDADVDTRMDAELDAGDADTDAGPRPACGACDARAPWRCDQCLDEDLQEISAITIDSRIYVVGGFEGRGRVVGTLRIYDPASDRWSEGPSLPVARHHVQLAALDGDLYALGGMQTIAFESLARSFVLRAGADAWEEIASLPRGRAAGFAAGIGDEIIVVAGQGEGRSNREKLDDAGTVFIYDPATDRFREGAPIPTTREHVAGVVYNDEIWVFGGRPISLEPTMDVVEIYNPREDAWRTGPTMPTPHGGFAAAVLDGVAYVCGGEERARALDLVEALDLEAGTWTTIDPVPTRRHGHAMAAAAGRVYVIGGADEPVFSAVDVVESFAP